MLLPGRVDAEWAQRASAERLPGLIIKRHDDGRQFVAVASGADLTGTDPCRDLKPRDFPSIDGESLHHDSRFARDLVFKRDVVGPFRGLFVLDPLELPLVIPAWHEIGLRRSFFEATVDQRRMQRVGLLLARVLGRARHRYEESGLEGLGNEGPIPFAHPMHDLLITRADGDDHGAAVLELVDQGLRNAFGRAGHDNLVEGSLFGPTLEPVTNPHVDVFVAKFLQDGLRLLSERFHDFDRIDFGDEAAEHGCLIAAASADLQDAIGRLRIERFGHERNDERRRDRLLLADWEGHVFVSEFARRARYKFVSRRSPHGINDPQVRDPRVEDRGLHHSLAGRVELGAGLRKNGSGGESPQHAHPGTRTTQGDP